MGGKEIYLGAEEIIGQLEPWIRDRISEAGAKGAVLGISGGVDSSALAALLRRILGREGLLALMMPCRSMPVDEEDATLLAEALDIQTMKVDLTETYDACKKQIEASLGELSSLAIANLKPRLRMTTLYAVAQTRGALVFGASNRCEMEFGYFTKFGDSGVDVLPFVSLLKGEVFRVAEHLGVPERIIKKPPTAGLWEGQTDEAEMGVTYADLDRYLATGEATPDVKKKIEAARARSAHKRTMPPMAKIAR